MQYLCGANAMIMAVKVFRPQSATYLSKESARGINDRYIPNSSLYFLAKPSPEVGVVAEPAELYGSLDQGYVFDDIQVLIQFLGFSQLELSKLFELDSSTLSRWRKHPKPIGLLRSRLVRELDAMVAKGVRLFGTEEAFSQWLDAPHAYLNGKAPKAYLRHPEGLLYVDDLLEGLSWGNFS